MDQKVEMREMRPLEAVRVSLPAAVAYDLGALQKGIAALGERLGCTPCVSGVDCLFLQERNFLINERLEIRAAPALPQDPIPYKTSVTLPRKVSYDLEQVLASVANIAERLGHPQCFSGFDIAFLQARDWVMDEGLNIHEPVEF